MNGEYMKYYKIKALRRLTQEQAEKALSTRYAKACLEQYHVEDLLERLTNQII